MINKLHINYFKTDVFIYFIILINKIYLPLKNLQCTGAVTDREP
jgi:hypothetical protein